MLRSYCGRIESYTRRLRVKDLDIAVSLCKSEGNEYSKIKMERSKSLSSRVTRFLIFRSVESGASEKK